MMNRIQSKYTIYRHGHYAAALFAIILATAGLANAEAMSGANPHKASHKTRKGHLTVAAATEAGGVMLPPGDYEVREVESRSGAVVEFARQVHNELASELVQADEEEIVARLNFTGQALSGAPKHTQLRLAASNSTDAVGLEIRGSAVGYVFARSTLSAASDTSDTAAACATDGTNR